jgi:hypothetical protein
VTIRAILAEIKNNPARRPRPNCRHQNLARPTSSASRYDGNNPIATRPPHLVSPRCWV